jgi:hypothetical protein
LNSCDLCDDVDLIRHDFVKSTLRSTMLTNTSPIHSSHPIQENLAHKSPSSISVDELLDCCELLPVEQSNRRASQGLARPNCPLTLNVRLFQSIVQWNLLLSGTEVHRSESRFSRPSSTLLLCRVRDFGRAMGSSVRRIDFNTAERQG